MALSQSERERVRAAALDGMFFEFWDALLDAVEASGLSPVRLLGSRAKVCRSDAAREALERLSRVDCPFDLVSSPWGWESFLAAFRGLLEKAGVKNARECDFNVLVGRV